MKVFRGMLQALLVCILLLAGLSVAYAEDTVLTITPAGGIITQPTEVSIECNNPGFYIYYQVVDIDCPDGLVDFMPYNGPFPVYPGNKVISAATTNPIEPYDATDLVVTTAAFDSQKVSALNITPASGIYEGDINVSITCDTDGAQIYYTLNGTVPDYMESTLYTGPFTVTSGTIVYAIGYKEYYKPSEMAQAIFDGYKASAPIFYPNSLTFYQPFLLTLNSTFPGEQIYYTLDGTEPGETSSLYTNPIRITETTTVKAIALAQGKENSDIVSAVYTLEKLEPPADPIISVGTGSDINTKTIGISCSTPDVTIYYTIDGTDPECYNLSERYTGPFSITEDATIKAIAVNNLTGVVSNISAKDVMFSRTKAPVITPNGGTYPSGEVVNVEIASETLNAVIYYTIDGKQPDLSSNIYSGSIEVSNYTVISAIAIAEGMDESPISTAVFHYPPVLTITPAGGIITQPTEVSIECNDPDFYVYFQRVNSFSGNGFDPELMPYNGSFTVNPGTKVIAAATRAPFDPESAVDLIETTVTFDPVRVSTPVITPASGIYEGDIIVSISCEEGATIYYYIDDENATEYLYTGPFTVNGCTTVTAWAVKEGIARSEAVTSNYRMPNRPPVAVLGGDRSYEYIGGMTNGAGVEIDATNSYDLDGDTLGYIWDLNVEYAEVEPGKIVLCAPIGLTDVKVTVTDGEYSSTDSITITVADTIAPEISAYYYAQGCDNYWYNNPVHISFGAIDTGTGVKNISPIDAVLLEEGKDQSVICSAEDNAGNTVEKVFSGFNIDLTPPTVIVNIADEYKVGDTLFLDVITEDALSGVLKSEITGVGTGGTVYHPGDQVELTYECTRGIWIMCQDMAGNETRELKVISVYDLNQPPEADDDSAVTDENAPVTIDVLTNDSDLDDDTLTITAVTNGANGIVTTNGTTVTYTPVTGFIGTDSFTYTISDGNGGTAIGTVTVRKIQTSPVLTWSNPTDIVYGTPLGIDQLNASSNVPGIFVYTPALGTILHTGGSQNLHVDFIPNDETSYNCVSLDVRINVIPATLTVKADNKIMKFGDTLPEFTATITGYVNGDDVSVLTGSPSLTLSNTVNGAGNYEIKVSRGSLGSTDYNFTFISGTLTVSSYNFQGFFQPVDMGSKVYNKVKAGSAIPIKFSLDGDQGLDIFLSSNYPGWLTISNPTGISTLDDIEQIVNAVGSSLKYDPSTKQYIYVWKTDKAWAGTSKQFIMIFKDGTKATANFQFVK